MTDRPSRTAQTSPTSLSDTASASGASRRVTDQERPKPQPLDEEALALLEKLWMLTRKNPENLAGKDAIMDHWISETLGSKMSLSLTKMALKSLIRTEEWWPAPVKFEFVYNTLRQQEGL